MSNVPLFDWGILVAPIRRDDTAGNRVREKNAEAAARGRLGGLKGGRVRAQRLSAARRQAIARKAARARWRKHRTAKKT